MSPIYSSQTLLREGVKKIFEFSNWVGGCPKGSFSIFHIVSVSLAFLVILPLGLKIEHFYWKLTEFCITLEPTMSKMLGKITFFGSF